ncbi:MAG: N-acetyltransferase [Prevotella sp.]|jgi:hypothetical protein|nr:N-acetyltransferase [Prevotella sp.]MCH4240317.1 N-acetyltransferase [Prevotella sp.]MCI1741853.1 N-acetyltransferase [Prevotella sp.]
MNTQIGKRCFKDIDLCDVFFDSLKEDYPGFSQWYNRKAADNAAAYVQYTSDGAIQAFLYLKIENGILNDVEPSRPKANRLKVGTFKIDAHNTKLGERFIKIITNYAINISADEIYVTIFEKQKPLIHLLNKYGFEKEGTKGKELVLIKDMKRICGDMLKDYPLISTINKKKYVLSIYPEYHTKLFPDSILNTEKRDKDALITDVSHTNSIHKIYVCCMHRARILRKGDLIVIYRSSDGKGPAWYRSVVTSVCQVEELKVYSDFKNRDDFVQYANEYSVYNQSVLSSFFKKNLIVIKMTYNVAFNKRITNKNLQEGFHIHPDYWGFFPLSNEQFIRILREGEVNENFIIDKA